VQELNYIAANRTALTLLIVSFAALLLVYSRRNTYRRFAAEPLVNDPAGSSGLA
jgi:hypothetical protein